MKVPNVNEYGIREGSMASGADIERDTVVRCVSGKYVALGNRA